jgi:hypothetical protein
VTSAAAIPLMSEIRLALTRLREFGEATILDLRDAPLGPHQEQRLFAVLQRDADGRPARRCGSCRIYETASPCVWIVEHFDSGGDVTAKFIEVTWWPELLEDKCADPGDPDLPVYRRRPVRSRRLA